MELKDFITNTLVEIADGVKNAQAHYKELGAAINPSQIATKDGKSYYITNNRLIHTEPTNFHLSTISFEICLTDSSSSDKKTGIGVFLASVGVGGNAQTQAGNISMTSVKFSLPAILPMQMLE